MSDFLKYFYLAICAAAFMSVVVVNPLHLSVVSELMLGLLVILSVLLAVLSIHRGRKPSLAVSPAGAGASEQTKAGRDAVRRVEAVHQSLAPLQAGATSVSSPHSTQAPIVVESDLFLKVVRLRQGELLDIKWGMTNVRLAILEIIKEPADLPGGAQNLYKAVIAVDTGGKTLYAGNDCKKLELNKYLLPQKSDVDYGDEELFSVFSFRAEQDYFIFFRAYVEHINPNSGQVTLNLFFCKQAANGTTTQSRQSGQT